MKHAQYKVVLVDGTAFLPHRFILVSSMWLTSHLIDTNELLRQHATLYPTRLCHNISCTRSITWKKDTVPQILSVPPFSFWPFSAVLFCLSFLYSLFVHLFVPLRSSLLFSILFRPWFSFFLPCFAFLSSAFLSLPFSFSFFVCFLLFPVIFCFKLKQR
jgi:hypothetical protein